MSRQAWESCRPETPTCENCAWLEPSKATGAGLPTTSGARIPQDVWEVALGVKVYSRRALRLDVVHLIEFWSCLGPVTSFLMPFKWECLSCCCPTIKFWKLIICFDFTVLWQEWFCPWVNYDLSLTHVLRWDTTRWTSELVLLRKDFRCWGYWDGMDIFMYENDMNFGDQGRNAVWTMGHNKKKNPILKKTPTFPL